MQIAKGIRHLTVALLVVSFTVTGCEQFQTAMIKRGVTQIANADRMDWLDDGALHLILCGTGSPLPDPKRAGPCAAVIAGGQYFLIDAGPGSWENVQVWQLPRPRLSGVLLTHFHSDHIGELGEVIVQSWIGGRAASLPVYGPPGVDRVVEGFQQAYSFDTGYRVAHHGAEALPPAGATAQAITVAIPEDGESALVLDKDGVRVTAYRVNHEPVTPAYGYRFEYAGRSVFITGDTAKSDGMLAGARDVDVLLSEVLISRLIQTSTKLLAEAGHDRLAHMGTDLLDYHISPQDAVATAMEAGAAMVVFTHIVPIPPNAIAQRLFLSDLDSAYEGDVLLGNDGMHFILPGGSSAIERSDLAE